MSIWTKILSPAEIAAINARTAALDPAFARAADAYYRAQTADQLHVLALQAWNMSAGDLYQMARSYRAMLGA